MSLQKIQERLKSPKSNYNNFGKYSYRSIEDIQEALKPVLAEYKYSLTISDDIVLIGDRYYVKSTASLCDDKGKVVAENTAFAREPADQKGMQPAQISGATSSYSRKYCLGGMFLLDDTKDADSHDNSKTPNYTTQQNHPNQPMQNQQKPKELTLPQKLQWMKDNKLDILKEAYCRTRNDALATMDDPAIISGQADQEAVLAECKKIIAEIKAEEKSGPPEY